MQPFFNLHSPIAIVYIHTHILYMYMCRISCVHIYILNVSIYSGMYTHLHNCWPHANEDALYIYTQTHMYINTWYTFVRTQTYCTQVHTTDDVNTPLPIWFEPEDVCPLIMPSHLVPISACPLPTDSKHVHMFIHSTLTLITGDGRTDSTSMLYPHMRMYNSPRVYLIW